MMYWPSDMQQWPLFHKLLLRIDDVVYTMAKWFLAKDFCEKYSVNGGIYKSIAST